MGMYSIEYFITCFVERTECNLKIIDKLSADKSVECYEVTQLLNSLFGLLIVPNEKYKFRYSNKNRIYENEYKDHLDIYKGLKDLFDKLKKEKRYYNDFRYNDYIGENITHLRNALCHSGNEGLHFLPMEENNLISSVIFYDHDDSNHEFCVEMNIDELKLLSKYITALYKKIDFEHPSSDLNAYHMQIEKYRELMKQ